MNEIALIKAGFEYRGTFLTRNQAQGWYLQNYSGKKFYVLKNVNGFHLYILS